MNPSDFYATLIREIHDRYSYIWFDVVPSDQFMGATVSWCFDYRPAHVSAHKFHHFVARNDFTKEKILAVLTHIEVTKP